MEQILGTLKKKTKHVNAQALMKRAHNLELSEQLMQFLKSIDVAWKPNTDTTVNLVCYVEEPVILKPISFSSLSKSVSPTREAKFTHHK